jgi:hypothetical protein
MNANLKPEDIPACTELRQEIINALKNPNPVGVPLSLVQVVERHEIAMANMLPMSRVIDKCMKILYLKSPEDYNAIAREIEKFPGWGMR